jgi:uncharacterized protein (TIGR02145 family)
MKILYSAMILLLVVVVSCDKNYKTASTPTTWKTSLGRASFATDSTWTIVSTDSTIIQVWSDAVQTDSCSGKTTFNGGSSSSYRIDCRSNPGHKGDLFSWRAVAEVENICPRGWRVPAREDFVNLDIAMGGNGENRGWEEMGQFLEDTYLNPSVWGGTRGGFFHLGSLDDFSNTRVFFYWSQTEHIDNGFSLYFITGSLAPQGTSRKNYGLPLRCVR